VRVIIRGLAPGRADRYKSLDCFLSLDPRGWRLRRGPVLRTCHSTPEAPSAYPTSIILAPSRHCWPICGGVGRGEGPTGAGSERTERSAKLSPRSLSHCPFKLHCVIYALGPSFFGHRVTRYLPIVDQR
jgi:hypothetical protein